MKMIVYNDCLQQDHRTAKKCIPNLVLIIEVVTIDVGEDASQWPDAAFAPVR